MRVLIIKTSSLGDVIHTLPALTDAAQAISGIRFDWVVEEGFAEIPSWHPAVDQVIPVAIRRWRKNLWQTIKSGEWKAFKQRVRERQYDLVIDAQGLVKSAWLTRYVKAPVAGLDRYSAREGWASRFYDRRLSVAVGQHAVERVRQLFAMALAYDLPEGIGNYGLDLDRLQLPPAAPYVVFLHGTTWATKHWPEAYWRELAERMGRRKLEVRLPWGNPAEKARAERIAQGLNNCQVLPKLNLAGVARVLAAAKACVAVDTGLGHLAAALDVPTISLFGPTNPGLTGAYGRTQIHQASDWPCAPCLQKKCTYKPSADDLRRYDLKREWPLCFTRLNPEHVASRLSALLLAEDVR
ncbi:lipopolysaccharide heptosyltransferase I [Pseudomonas anuradhapurensis]|uniref:lipopolysaccharide heptosyltransferase I n=1 Tax=Pseudomonas anuradhapurensis TaxID=485870 RepID=UPI0016475797|nr:lipopolysaccharide heptosyltransferase I [Pseudomonas anuradhapurensis]QXI48193.1 lipopolysaccharide heptosyltransferase I [Pseudomonas anuradhapurensis]